MITLQKRHDVVRPSFEKVERQFLGFLTHVIVTLLKVLTIVISEFYY